jgi:hypothetical protein
MAKKLKITLNFDNLQLKPDVATSEDSETLDSLQNEIPVIRQWTENELFLGESGKLNHLDHLTLNLGTTKSDVLKQSISGWARFPIGFQKILDSSGLQMVFNKTLLTINGQITISLNVKESIWPDVTNFQHRLLFSSLNFRLKHSGKIATFTKYGENWELESNQKKLYIAELDDSYVQNLPTITIKKK